MPVETTQTVAQFPGDGIVTVFPFNFPFLLDTDMVVTLSDLEGVDDLQVLGTDYTITGAGTSAGSVTMAVAPLTGERLTIDRQIPATQLLSFEFKTRLSSESITQALDKLTMLVQQLATIIFGGKVLRFPNTDPSNVNGLLPPQAQRLGLFLRFDDILGNPQVAAVGDADNIGVLLCEADMASRSATNASCQLAIALFVEDKILDEDDFASDDPLRAPSQQSTAVFILSEIEDALAINDPLGVLKPIMTKTIPTRHVEANDLTIGSAASGSTNRADPDTEDLFSHFWDEFTDAEIAIFDSVGAPSTRGASASVDFAADKRMTVPTQEGLGIAGHDPSNIRLTGTLTGGVDGSVVGQIGGDEGHVMITVEMPSHGHALTNLFLPAHVHDSFTNTNEACFGNNGTLAEALTQLNPGQTLGVVGLPIEITGGIVGNTGGDTAHNNVMPVRIVKFMYRL